MALRHDFEKKGILLFKHRGQLPLVLFAAAIPAIYLSDLQLIESDKWVEVTLLITCVLISLSGQIIRALAIGKSAKQTSGRNTWGHEAKALNTTGIYSTVRHPLYLGNFFMWMGIVIFTGHPWFILVVILAFWLYYERIMFSEDAFLEREFGEEFLSWSEKTPAFIPSRKHYEPTTVSFSMKTILRREYPGISAAVIGFVYVDFVREWMYHGAVQWKWMHAVVLFVALLFAYVLKLLKHKTKVLTEVDRS